MNTIYDVNGVPVIVGDSVAVAFRMGTKAELRVGRVTDILPKSKRRYDDEEPSIDQVEFEWLMGGRYGLPQNRTKLETHDSKFRWAVL